MSEDHEGGLDMSAEEQPAQVTVPVATASPEPGDATATASAASPPALAETPPVVTVAFRKGIPGSAMESLELRYLRQTRNATVFVAVAVAIVMVLGLVGAISIIKLNSELSQAVNGTSSSNCMSQGGSDPSC